VLGFVIFGMGIAGYYSISMPAVGLCVPESIRGIQWFYMFRNCICVFRVLADCYHDCSSFDIWL